MAQVVEARGELRPLGRGAGGVVFEDAFAPGLGERVALSVEDLAPFGGGDSCVSDEAHDGVLAKNLPGADRIVGR